MPSLSERITIPFPPELVWPLLSDPGIVASCIPGATLTAPTEEGGAYIGTVRVAFGPTVALFRGEARLSYDHEERRCAIEGRGIDGRGQSRATASGSVSASGVGTTVLRIEGSFNVTGPLETVANGGGAQLARALLGEFSRNIAKLVAVEGVPAPEAAAIPLVEPVTPAMQARAAALAEPVSELRGGSVLWRAFLSRVRQIFSGKSPRGPR